MLVLLVTSGKERAPRGYEGTGDLAFTDPLLLNHAPYLARLSLTILVGLSPFNGSGSQDGAGTGPMPPVRSKLGWPGNWACLVIKPHLTGSHSLGRKALKGRGIAFPGLGPEHIRKITPVILLAEELTRRDKAGSLPHRRTRMTFRVFPPPMCPW